jgi:hypothetical protein
MKARQKGKQNKKFQFIIDTLKEIRIVLAMHKPMVWIGSVKGEWHESGR